MIAVKCVEISLKLLYLLPLQLYKFIGKSENLLDQKEYLRHGDLKNERRTCRFLLMRKTYKSVELVE